MIRAEGGVLASGKGKKARWRGPLVALAGTGLAAIVLVALMRSGPRAAREPGLNVLLITIDTLRADAVGAYGRAPWIDHLAAAGVRFDRAHAHSVLTLPSHASILSGLLPLAHGIRDNDGFRFPTTRETLATLLKQRGYATAAFVSAFPLDSRFGLDRAFDVYDDRFSNADTRAAFTMEERPGKDTVAAARDWIASRGSQPFFCWVHLYDPHFPYAPPEPYASRFRSDLYAGEVAAADAALGPLVDPILQAGSGGRVLVVLTADHGEALGDHGEKTHGIFAYESTLRVPLILFAPRLLKPGVVHENGRHIDILPTVLDALAIPSPAGLPGHSLIDRRSGSGEVSYFESLSPARSRGWAPLYGLIKDGWKYVDLPIPELYDLAADPNEARNLAAARPAMVSGLHRELTGLRAADPGSRGAREDPEVRERLKSLGYLAGGGGDAPRRYTEEDDPKRLIAIDTLLQSAAEHYGSGDLDAALRLCAEAVKQRPDNAEATAQLGSLHRLAGRLGEAIPLLQKAVALQPDNEQNVALLATTLGEAGRPAQALGVLDPYARRAEADIDVLMALGIARAQVGRTSEALAAFERVRTVDPSNAMALVNIATVHLGAGDPARARQALEAAVALNPRVARAHNALGVIAAEAGHAPEAVEHWKSALELEPRDLDTLYNLGRLLWAEGQHGEARPYLERFVREASPSLHAKDIAEVRGWLASPR